MLRPRGMGIMDFIAKTGADLITPPQASPVFQGQTPLQTSMGRPEVQFSQPSASTMATSYPSGMAAMASPTPQVQAMMRGQAPERTAIVTPPEVTSARPQMLEPNRMMGQRGAIGSGVMQEGVDREKMIAANKIAEVEAKNPELKTDPSFQDRVKGLFGDREKMLGLALAFNSMRLRPDTGLATIIGSELKDIRDTRKLQAASTRTAEYFKGIGRQDLAGLVENQVLSGKDAIELSKKTQGSVVTAQQLRQKYPDADIEDGLYNIKPNGNITKVGGGGVSVQVGGPEAIQPGLEAAGKTIMEKDIEGSEQALTALNNIAKTDEVLRLLDEGQPVTGLTAPIEDLINNAKAIIGDEEAIKKASDTGLLNALLGQEVFGSITALGIGARGLDTPAEREFLREVMAGTISMTEDTIREIAKLRRKYATEVINRYNKKVESGDYDLLNKTFGNRYQKIEIPGAPELIIPPVPDNLPPGVTADMWPEMYRKMPPTDRALFVR